MDGRHSTIDCQGDESEREFVQCRLQGDALIEPESWGFSLSWVVGRPLGYYLSLSGNVRIARDSGVGSPSHLSEMPTIRPSDSCSIVVECIADLGLIKKASPWGKLSRSATCRI